MKRPVLQSALRDLHQFASNWRYGVTFLVIVLLFTLIGPFGTDAFAPLARFGFWLAIQGSAWFFATTLAVFANAALPAAIRPEFLRLAIGSVLACPLIGASILFIRMGATGAPVSLSGWVHESIGAVPLSLLFCLLAYTAAAPSIDRQMARGARTALTPAEHESGEPPGPTLAPRAAVDTAPTSGLDAPPRLLARLKPANRAPLLRLAVEDHYTRVVTARGSELVLLRFSDAVREAGDIGLQVHRSHWVAFANIKALSRDGSRLTLETEDGTRVPVSRPYAPAVRERLRENANKA
ncbi:transcriptional regulator, LytTR family [Rhizobium sp. RU20A]|uniref:LytTR family DNA-binding domain-containing protein n=1 Tax=Rhizobium sp. RU20A TaxID=1907412 RepID=UPI000954CFF1|nr:LytTR family DNA-binding domain-containing protein [Rhizobium sp. RU20A]SIQ24927.1 transcriptional regulator, LytTR family [Rhizobium sp. RU20A]